MGFFSPFLHSTGSLSVSREYLALPDGAGRFRQGVSDPALLRIPLFHFILRLRDCHPLWFNFPKDSASMKCSSVVLQPPDTNVSRFGLFRFRSPLLTESLNCFLFLRLLRCFSSPGSPPPYGRFQVFNLEGCPIRKSADRSLYAAPRSLSQLTTSFVVSESQGIHHAPLFTSYSLVDSRIIKLSIKYLQTLNFSLIQPFKELYPQWKTIFPFFLEPQR